MKARPIYLLFPICAIGVAIRVFILLYFATWRNGTPVDIYYADQQAARQLLDFRDPYLYTGYTNHYGASLIYVYLPLIPVYFAPFVLAGVDIRYGSILADVVITLAVYVVARAATQTSLGNPWAGWVPLLASTAYTILPISIWLTSAVGSNLMVGTMFLMMALAAIATGRRLAAGFVLGLGLASDQFVILLLPAFAAYLLARRDYRTLVISVAVALAVVAPFIVAGPSQFVHDVVVFQFTRQLQMNGDWSLYSLVYTNTGFAIPTYTRVCIVLLCAVAVVLTLRSTLKLLLAGLFILGSAAAFALPVDGFWSYFLLPVAVLCALVFPVLLDYSQRGRPRPK